MGKFDSSDDGTAPTKMLGRKKISQLSGEIAANKKVGERGLDDIPEDTPIISDQENVGGGNFYKGDTLSSKATSGIIPDSGEKTIVFRPSKKAVSGLSVPEQQTNLAGNQTEVYEKPVIGWLVIIKGPGKGRGLPLSYGKLQIGRDEGQDIPIRFGDEEITRMNHASVEYDKKTREFYLFKGENLIYLNGKRVGMGGEEKLSTGDEIELSDSTTLRFVSFCGSQFDWND